jgi:hypothetical protein
MGLADALPGRLTPAAAPAVTIENEESWFDGIDQARTTDDIQIVQ